MAKVSGSYESVIKGVSEQVPQDRRPGQHFEQINMISDPVRGLSRRHGSIVQDEEVQAAYTSEAYTKWLADTARHKVFTFFVDGVEYDLIYRSTADTQNLDAETFAWAFNKDTKNIIPVVMHSDTDDLIEGGVSAITNVGKYLFIAGNNMVPGYTASDKWGATTNRQKMAVWIRSGAYSRTYKVTVWSVGGGLAWTASYTTKAASYPFLLDTSDIAAADDQYQKKVNDRVNAYNGNVTKWIGDAAEDITPQNIAAQLASQLTGFGITGVEVVNSTIQINNASYAEVVVSDGGDSTSILGAGGEVDSIDKLTSRHFAGKIIKIRPKKNNGEDAIYVKAIPVSGAVNGGWEGVIQWDEVTWKEVAGYEMTPDKPFCLATVVDQTMYIAATPATLTSLSGDPTPLFKANEVGDDITSPVPFFMGKKIDYLGLFQDRLVIGCGAVLFFSRPGDYFNWYKNSVLNVQDNDPVEIYALGSEDDTIKTSTTYDRNLLLFGRRKQYVVNGRSPLTPKSATIVPLSAHEDAVDAEPQASGNFVFYTKNRNNTTSMHQIQMGQLADSPESFAISQQLDSYIQGKPVEIVPLTAPNNVFLRTDANRNELYVYTYLDTASGAERLFDSWSRWRWHPVLGSTVGISKHEGDIIVYLIRHGLDADLNPKIWFAVERFSLDTRLSEYPYFDSIRPVADVLEPTADTFIHIESETPDVWVAFPRVDNDDDFLGTDIENLDDFLEQYENAETSTYVGVNYDAFVTPTNPYIKDRDGKVMINGRLTLSRVIVSVSDTSGMKTTVETVGAPGVDKSVGDFTGRILGRTTNRVGRVPIVTTSVTSFIGKEVRDCKYTLHAKTFLPLTVTAIEWHGQYFNNVRRV